MPATTPGTTMSERRWTIYVCPEHPEKPWLVDWCGCGRGELPAVTVAPVEEVEEARVFAEKMLKAQGDKTAREREIRQAAEERAERAEAANETAWAAGLFDGEGSFVLMRTTRPGRKPKARACLSMTDKALVERFAAAVGMGNVGGPEEREGRRPMWRWTLNREQEVKAFADLLWPWLGEAKRIQATEAFEGHVPNQATSEHPNVGWDSGRKKWRARIRHNGEDKFLGNYASEDAAIRAVENFRASVESPECERCQPLREALEHCPECEGGGGEDRNVACPACGGTGEGAALRFGLYELKALHPEHEATEAAYESAQAKVSAALEDRSEKPNKEEA